MVTLDTLLGISEEPGDLIGHGPITANTARDLALASGSTWTRLIVDPVNGYLLDYGRTKYRPPVALADHVRARDYTCRTPNCDRPAAKSDLDHIIPWPAGATSENNLGCACDRDHRMKHQGKWTHRLSTDPDHPERTLILTSPTGQVYISYPHSYLEPPIQKPTPKTTPGEPSNPGTSTGAGPANNGQPNNGPANNGPANNGPANKNTENDETTKNESGSEDSLRAESLPNDDPGEPPF